MGVARGRAGYADHPRLPDSASSGLQLPGKLGVRQCRLSEGASAILDNWRCKSMTDSSALNTGPGQADNTAGERRASLVLAEAKRLSVLTHGVPAYSGAFISKASQNIIEWTLGGHNIGHRTPRRIARQGRRLDRRG